MEVLGRSGRLLAVALAAAALGLVGCSNDDEARGESAVIEVLEFSSMEEMRDAYLTIGDYCDEIKDAPENVMLSVSCDDGIRLYHHKNGDREHVKKAMEVASGLNALQGSTGGLIHAEDWSWAISMFSEVDEALRDQLIAAFAGNFVTHGDLATASEPDVDLSSSCDYVLGDFTTDPDTGYRFIADAVLTNNGVQDERVELIAVWHLAGGDSVKKVKEVSVPAGKSVREGFSVPASSDQIDRHQSATGTTCEVDGSIL